jgi:hypothetical protein
MKTGDELVLQAMRREFARLSRIADKAKAEADEALNIGTEYMEIHKELIEIVNSKEHGKKEVLEKMKSLKLRRGRADRIMKKDMAKLIEKEVDAQVERDTLGIEIDNMEWRLGMRKERCGQ